MRRRRSSLRSKQSGFAASIRQSLWLYPAANVGHIVSLIFFAGAIAVMDVRLLGGFAATAPARLLARARNFAFAALAGMAMTGFVLFSAEASHLAVNRVFQLKVVLIARRSRQYRRLRALGETCSRAPSTRAPMPARAKIAGMLSLGIWVAVAACGRSIAYF